MLTHRCDWGIEVWSSLVSFQPTEKILPKMGFVCPCRHVTWLIYVFLHYTFILCGSQHFSDLIPKRIYYITYLTYQQNIHKIFFTSRSNHLIKNLLYKPHINPLPLYWSVLYLKFQWHRLPRIKSIYQNNCPSLSQEVRYIWFKSLTIVFLFCTHKNWKLNSI